MRFAFAAALVFPLFALAACGDSADPTPPPAASAPVAAPTEADPPADEVAAVTSGGTVGAAGSACELPIAFDFAEDWKPVTVSAEASELSSGLVKGAEMRLLCEIDAKPAGNLGFLRVWTTKVKSAEKALEAYVGDDGVDPVYTEVQLGGKPAVEVAYQKESELDEGVMDNERAFAMSGDQGTVLVVLDSFDNDEFDAMLPAYELAKSTVKA